MVFGLLALGIAFGPRVARAQGKAGVPASIGFLSPNTASAGSYSPSIACFRDGLRDAGWVEGKNIAIEYRWAGNVPDRYPALAAELVGLRPDLIVASGTPGTQALQRTTRTIPVVMIAVSDPV